MKKLIAISILLVLLSVTAFAQFKVAFGSNIWTDAVFFQGATGDMADADSVQGAFNVLANNRGKATNELRLTFSFTGDGFSASLRWDLDNLLRRGGDGTQGNGNGYTVSNTNEGPAPGNVNVANSTTPAVAGLSTGSGFFGNGASPLSMLVLNFGDYSVQNTKGLFRGFVGNGDRRGAMTSYRFGNFGDLVGGGVNSFGVVKFYYINENAPGSGNDFSNMVGNLKDVDNLKVAPQGASGTGAHVDLSLYLVELGLPDIRVEVSSNAMFAGWANTMPLNSNGVNGTTNIPATSASSIAASFRLSGAKVADFISFDAIYRINGQDPNTRLTNNNAVADPLGNNTAATGAGTTKGGAWSNDVGLYAGFDLFSMLGVGVGVTASFDSVEQTRVGNFESATAEYVKPLFLGFDLRLRLKLSDDIVIDFNNNLSLAGQRGEASLKTDTGGRFIQPLGYNLPSWGKIAGSNRTTEVKGVWSFQEYYGSAGANILDDTLSGLGMKGNMWNTDMSDGWFALWSTLSGQIILNPKVTLNATIGNRLGVYDFIGVPEKEFAKWTTDNFQAGVQANYRFSGNVSFAAGLHLSVWGMQADITTTTRDKDGNYLGAYVKDSGNPPQLTSGKIGQVQFSIPIKFQVSF